MPKLILPVLATVASIIGASAASAQGLTATQARAIIAPWYSLFNVATRGDVKATQEQVLTADYEFCPPAICRANAGAATRRSRSCQTSLTRFPT